MSRKPSRDSHAVGGSAPRPSRRSREDSNSGALHGALRRWYRRHRRPLPWRRTRDPYRIWVSEVMLQQTRVATAIPYYQRFIGRFPTLHELARAPSAAVLAAWAGLGYYRRARHLHEAARIVVREHGGRVPATSGEFARLPGVGPYTHGAVMSIAFDHRLPALDGNAARVLSRLYALHVSVRDSRGARRLTERAAALVPAVRPGEWNQALMELGARVCTPRAPRCVDCPLRAWCRARAEGRAEVYPARAMRPATRRVRRAIALLERDGALLMVRRRGVLLGGLWEPPGIERGEPVSAEAALAAELERLGVRAKLEPLGVRLRHRITHHEIDVELWRGVLGRARPPSGARLVDPSRPGVAITALARHAAHALAAASRTSLRSPGSRPRLRAARAR